MGYSKEQVEAMAQIANVKAGYANEAKERGCEIASGLPAIKELPQGVRRVILSGLEDQRDFLKRSDGHVSHAKLQEQFVFVEAAKAWIEASEVGE